MGPKQAGDDLGAGAGGGEERAGRHGGPCANKLARLSPDVGKPPIGVDMNVRGSCIPDRHPDDRRTRLERADPMTARGLDAFREQRGARRQAGIGQRVRRTGDPDAWTEPTEELNQGQREQLVTPLRGSGGESNLDREIKRGEDRRSVVS